jgi:peptidyl-prolyl cis-trans isomerase C
VTKLWREPLLHFVLFGGVLFAIDRLTGDETVDRTIEVSADLRSELARQWSATHDGPPPEGELDRLVEEWIDDEVLYREGLARGLDRDDPSVRGRVAAKMGIIVRSEVIVAEPSDEELRAFFEGDRARWAEPARIDFTHVFVADADRARAEELLALVRSGATPSGLGDRFSGGRRYRGRRVVDLARAFGDDFARGLDAQPIGAWEIRASRFGLHVLRVDAHTQGRAPSLSDVRADVRRAWMDERRAREVRRAMRSLRERWEIER